MDAALSAQLWDTLNAYSNPDCDTQMVFRHWDEPAGSRVLEIGANEEYSAYVLAQHGYNVVGVDMRDESLMANQPQPQPAYHRIKADFVEWAKTQPAEQFDTSLSTSAIEHFGLLVYGQKEPAPDYDEQTMAAVHRLLRPGVTSYITVPYGRDFREDTDWRVYNEAALRKRLIQQFYVETMRFFKSGECNCPDRGWDDVAKDDADNYHGTPPHVTVLLVLRKMDV